MSSSPLSTPLLTDLPVPQKSRNVFAVIFLVLIGLSAVFATGFGILGIWASMAVPSSDLGYVKTRGQIIDSCQEKDCQVTVQYEVDGVEQTYKVKADENFIYIDKDKKEVELWYSKTDGTSVTFKEPSLSSLRTWLLVWGIVTPLLSWLIFGLVFWLFRFLVLV
jgi:hypothetical protein